MAKMTEKTETTTGAAKPAARRKTTAAPAPEAEKVTTRRRTKSQLEPTHEEIALRAYHLFLRRRGWPGSPEHDWLQAVNELRREKGLV